MILRFTTGTTIYGPGQHAIMILNIPGLGPGLPLLRGNAAYALTPEKSGGNTLPRKDPEGIHHPVKIRREYTGPEAVRTDNSGFHAIRRSAP